MNGCLSELATIERIGAIESELAVLRVDAYRRAGIPLPSENKQIGRIVRFAGVAFSVAEGSILGPSRSARLCRARFAIAWVAHQAFGLSSVVIGRALGDRDHSTVLSAIRRAEEWRAGDEDYRQITDRLLALISPKRPDIQEAADAASCNA